MTNSLDYNKHIKYNKVDDGHNKRKNRTFLPVVISALDDRFFIKGRLIS